MIEGRALAPRLIVAAMSLMTWACIDNTVDPNDSTSPLFVDGKAQDVPEFSDPARWIRQELWVETEFDSDGNGTLDRMHVAVVRPKQTESDGLRVPVIYESSPYYAGTAGVSDLPFWPVEHEVGSVPPSRAQAPSVTTRARPGISSTHVATWVPRGFAVVHSEAPGTGLSQGCPTIGGLPEGLAPKAVIDWLNGRARGFTTPDGNEEIDADWSTGRVGMLGASFNGTITWAAAATGVDGLEAIIPMAAVTSWYRYYRSNGLVRSPGGYLGEDVDVLYDYVNSGPLERRAYCDATYRDGEFATGKDRVTGDYNDFWASRSLLGRMDDVRAAVLIYHGLNDWNVMPSQAVRAYEELKRNGAEARVYFHDQAHIGYPPPDLTNAWFSHYLYGVENGIESDPKSLIVRVGDDPFSPTAYPDYPHPQASPVTLYPGAGGIGVGTLAPSASIGQGLETLVDDVSFTAAALAQAPESSHRLLYATPPLAENLHLSGTPRVTLRLASSKPATNLSVYLVMLPWEQNGPPTGGLITRTWADPQNRASLRQGSALTPGVFYDLTLELEPDDQVVEVGKRIGLMIFGSDPEFTVWPAPGTELTVDLDATSIELPVVGGEVTLQHASGR